MLVCGCVNPPPVSDPGYRGVYFSTADDLAAKAREMRDTPLRIEHCAGTDVGKVLNAWTGGDGRMYALAEVDTRTAGGAVAASYVRTGRLGEFSLGYTSKVRMSAAGGIAVGDKRIHELSLVKQGARPGCSILRHSPY